MESREDGGREKWARKAEFILSCLGYCIGLSNIWRFPYLCYRHGGGAFLVPYFLMLFVAGIPLFFMEVGLAQFTSAGVLGIYSMCPLLKAYYNIIIAYSLFYLGSSFQSHLPWADCSHEWNSEQCVDFMNVTLNGEGCNATAMDCHLPSAQEKQNAKVPADEFFHNHMLEISSGIEEPGRLVWKLALCAAISWIIIFACLSKGIKTMGKVWGDAAVQIFFSLGPGWGGFVTMASFNPFRNNIRWECAIIPLMNCLTSLFAGFVVFSVLGFMSLQTGKPVSEVATAGKSISLPLRFYPLQIRAEEEKVIVRASPFQRPNLAFVTYPQAIALMPGAPAWAVLFFFMLFTLGVDSEFVQVETFIAGVADEYPSLKKHKTLVTALTCLVLFGASLSCVTQGGMYVLQLLDWYAGTIPIILVCFIEVAMVAWIYGKSLVPWILGGARRFTRDLEFMLGSRIWKIIPFFWSVLTPLALVAVFVTVALSSIRVTYGDYVYPDWAVGLGWLSASVSMACIPVYIIYKMSPSPGSLLQVGSPRGLQRGGYRGAYPHPLHMDPGR
ncbi:unnamed protein product [Darwinula stevensoni]|uniref:Transporter n=1 Tax=Darwinula stevensoni TaxID=69355 RepID=A0A7R8X2T1_9CRUS|nr:unnamed protein product [Darwinula stevensoni]CAG0881788.1 unnamed protein product [Darwinula stevensoni]